MKESSNRLMDVEEQVRYGEMFAVKCLINKNYIVHEKQMA